MDQKLTPEQSNAIERLIEAGVFASRDEAIAQSFEWLKDEADKLDAIRKKIETSLRQSARGESLTLDADEIWQQVRERLNKEAAQPSVT
ncbi:MAG: hypothetical protein GKS00_00030 [Alphaproteobacteria bacterium]|nr:hypothetical protein [Alphaproteobacteria bacterium]